MPFPLAHPAAVLPLRRLCPRRFNFPALVIGSLCPDVGYCFGQSHLDKFSHRFLAGTFGFCLPTGLLLLLIFYRLRRPVVQILPPRFRQILEPLCLRPVGSIIIILLSILTGAWTHLFLDSVTHLNGWIVTHFTFLQESVGQGFFRLRVCNLLYDLTTFAGAAWLALAYLNWLERVAGPRAWIFPGFKWCASLMFAAFTLLLSVANHNISLLELADIGVLTVALSALFFLATGWALRDKPANEPRAPRRQETENVSSQISEGNTV
jgi:hypothetical protein